MLISISAVMFPSCSQFYNTGKSNLKQNLKEKMSQKNAYSLEDIVQRKNSGCIPLTCCFEGGKDTGDCL